MNPLAIRQASSFFTFFIMGQYFRAVNQTKKEFICPWCLGGGAKLWEWSANPYGAVFTLLLRRSSATGGGDYNGPSSQLLDASEQSPDSIVETIARGVLKEGKDAGISPDSIVGRWAGDEVYLVGDYDESGLYQRSKWPAYRNISHDVVEVWNDFIGIEDKMLIMNTECSCQDVPTETSA